VAVLSYCKPLTSSFALVRADSPSGSEHANLANVCFWHLADISAAPAFVRYWTNSGQAERCSKGAKVKAKKGVRSLLRLVLIKHYKVKRLHALALQNAVIKDIRCSRIEIEPANIEMRGSRSALVSASEKSRN
jgi:hypothetical protein